MSKMMGTLLIKADINKRNKYIPIKGKAYFDDRRRPEDIPK